jgi:hypothetical protein
MAPQHTSDKCHERTYSLWLFQSLRHIFDVVSRNSRSALRAEDELDLLFFRHFSRPFVLAGLLVCFLEWCGMIAFRGEGRGVATPGGERGCIHLFEAVRARADPYDSLVSVEGELVDSCGMDTMDRS